MSRRFFSSRIAVALLLVSIVSPVQADTNWSLSPVYSGDWSGTSNWDNGVPMSSTNAYITNGGTATISQTGEVCNSLSLGNGHGSGTIRMTDGSLVTTSYEYIGSTGTGAFRQSGGTNTTLTLYLASDLRSTGSYVLDAGCLTTTYQEWIGSIGTGTFTQNGGTHNAGHFFLGNSYDDGWGDTYYGDGHYTLNGSGVMSAIGEEIGYQGTGEFTQNGGTNTITGSYGLMIGLYQGRATYNLNGGSLVLYALGAGPFSGGATFNFGAGTLQASAAFNTSQPMTLTGAGGNANVDTAGYAVTFSGQISGSGGLNKLGNGTLTLLTANSYSGNTTISRGTLTLANANALQGTTLDYDGYGGTLSFGSLTAATLGGLKGNQNLAIRNASSAAVALSVGGNGESTTYSGQLSGGGSLKKLGAGTLTLAGNNSYLGSTTVSAGTLKVNNTIGSATGSGTVTVDSGATLAGSGVINGSVTIAGTLAPGNSTGILTVNNQVTFQSGSTFSAEVFGLAAGSGYDQLTTTGPVSLSGSLALPFGSFTPTGNDILFLINNTGAGTTSGTFQYADNAEIGTFNGFNWHITYEANNAPTPSISGGNDVAIYSEPVPEPSTLVLLVTGFLSLSAFAWRRRKQRS
jgi:fibronectin-binding autotransporter adhesin